MNEEAREIIRQAESRYGSGTPEFREAVRSECARKLMGDDAHPGLQQLADAVSDKSTLSYVGSDDRITSQELIERRLHREQTRGGH